MKKILIIICSIIIILLLVVKFRPVITSEDTIISLANMAFGDKNCNGNEVYTDDFTERNCLICNDKYNGSSSTKICPSCSEITNRCNVCGGLR